MPLDQLSFTFNILSIANSMPRSGAEVKAKHYHRICPQKLKKREVWKRWNDLNAPTFADGTGVIGDFR
jgi:hypothetical protein